MVQTEKALITLLDIGNKVVEAVSDDGKVDFGEGIQISVKAIGLVSAFKNLGVIQEEIKAAKPEDITALVEVFKTKFDLPNDEAEAKIEAGVEMLAQLALVVFGKQ